MSRGTVEHGPATPTEPPKGAGGRPGKVYSDLLKDTRGNYYFKHLGAPKRCKTKDRTTAQAYMRAYAANGGSSPDLLPLKPILEAYPTTSKNAWLYGRLIRFWKTRRVRDLGSKSTCQAYVAFSREERQQERVTDFDDLRDSTARRELKMLFARVREAVERTHPRHLVKCAWKPRAGAARSRFLFADEIERFFLVALGRKVDPRAPDGWMRDPLTGRPVLEDKATRARWEPVARLIMIGAYTGSRKGAMETALWSDKPGFGFMDLEVERFYRSYSEAPGAIKSSPIVRIYRKLLRYMRACRRRDRERGFDLVIHGPGGGTLAINPLFAEVRRAAGLDGDVVIHTLRHSCATILLAGGARQEEVAEFLGITVENLLEHYAQVHPRFTDRVGEALDDAAADVPLSVSVARAFAARRKLEA